MRQSKFESFSTYFEDVANRHPSIMWYHEIDEDEILSGIRSKTKYPCLILECPEFSIRDNSFNTDAMIPTGIAVVAPVPVGNFVRRKEVLVQTEQILLDIISQLREDDRLGNFHVNSNDLKYAKIGPWTPDNLYGWRLDLTYQEWVDLHYRAEEWNEYNPDKFK